MYSFLNIAIFILGTTTKNGRDYQTYPTYFESRIIPIVVTWGQYYPYLYFVFGTNKYDYQFLTKRCRLLNDNNNITTQTYNIHAKKNRLLRARVAQIPLSNSVDKYLCPIYASDLYYLKNLSITFTSIDSGTNSTRNSKTQPLKRKKQRNTVMYEYVVLLTKNCTGEYFGYGPTCRCQEAMRYYNNAYLDKVPSVEWFMFMDDDVYIRPYSLVSMLTTAAKNVNINSTSFINGLSVSMSLISAKESSGHFITHKAATHCNVTTAYSLSRAQPCILNRASMRDLSSALHSNALTSLQNIWGGSHDSLLGLLLWIYAIPSYSFDSAYFNTILYTENERVTSSLATLNTSMHFIFHRIGSRIQYHWSVAEKKLLKTGEFAGYYDIAALVGDDVLYTYELYKHLRSKSLKALTTNSSSISSTNWRRRRSIVKEQSIQIGKLSGQMLLSLPVSTIHTTLFAKYAANIRTTYMNFTKEFCKLLK